jgi:hypothetical protein
VLRGEAERFSSGLVKPKRLVFLLRFETVSQKLLDFPFQHANVGSMHPGKSESAQ